MKKMTPIGWGLLAASVIAIMLEIAGAIKNDEGQDTWTEMIVEWWPWQLSLAIYAALAVWVPVHFYLEYRKQKRAEETNV